MFQDYSMICNKFYSILRLCLFLSRFFARSFARLTAIYSLMHVNEMPCFAGNSLKYHIFPATPEWVSSSERKNETDGGRGRKFRGRRKTRLVVSVLSVCRRETRTVSTQGMHHEGCSTVNSRVTRYDGRRIVVDVTMVVVLALFVVDVVVVCVRNRTNTLSAMKGCAQMRLTHRCKLFTKRIHLQKNILEFLRSVCVLREKWIRKTFKKILFRIV